MIVLLVKVDVTLICSVEEGLAVVVVLLLGLLLLLLLLLKGVLLLLLLLLLVLPQIADPSEELLEPGEAECGVPSYEDWSASAEVMTSRERFGTRP